MRYRMKLFSVNDFRMRFRERLRLQKKLGSCLDITLLFCHIALVPLRQPEIAKVGKRPREAAMQRLVISSR